MNSSVNAIPGVILPHKAEAPTPAQAQAVHAFIRDYLCALDGAEGEGVRILYGGSVRGDNAARLASEPDIDGALVGGASMALKDFLAICAGFNV